MQLQFEENKQNIYLSLSAFGVYVKIFLICGFADQISSSSLFSSRTVLVVESRGRQKADSLPRIFRDEEAIWMRAVRLHKIRGFASQMCAVSKFRNQISRPQKKCELFSDAGTGKVFWLNFFRAIVIVAGMKKIFCLLISKRCSA